MTKEDILDIRELLNTPKKIVIAPHKNPDGDAIGASLALYLYLIKKQHQVTVIAPNDYPDFLKWMPSENLILKYDTNANYCNTKINEADLIFTLDFNALNRTGDMEPALKNSTAIKIMIDHHQQPEAYAKYTYSDTTMSSTCEMIYHFLAYLNDLKTIHTEIATCIYTGIMTDTGSFRFPATTSTTHKIIAHLIDLGAKPATIHQAVYDTNSYNRLQLLGCALQNLKVLPEFRTAYISLSNKELKKFDFNKGDTEGFVNYALSLKNIVFAAIFIEDVQQEIIKISLRSKGEFSVNQFARKHYNGGGHINAAGGKSETSLDETISDFICNLQPYKNDLNHA